MATKNDYSDELYSLVATGKLNADDAAIKLDESGVEVTDEVYDNFRQAEKDYNKSQRGLEVGDIVTVKGKNGLPNFEGNFRGITNDGKYIVVGKNGYQNSYDKSDIIVEKNIVKSTEKKESTMAKKELVVSNSGFKVISVEDSLKKYTPELSDNDIKGFVWYNRTLGIPMTGFEKWFMPNTSKNVVVAKDDVNFLNQQYQIVGKFQAGDEVGKVTRFENEYAGTIYVAVRRFDNSLCLVDKSQLSINNKYEVSTKDLDELVKTQSLMYLNEMYLPLHVYTNTDYDTLKSALLKDKQHIISKYGQDVYDYHEAVLSGFISMRVDHPIKDKRYILNPYGEISRETKTIPPSEEFEISVTEYFEDYVKKLNNSDFKLVSKSVYIDRIINQIEKSGASKTYKSDEENKKLEEQRDKEIADSKLERDRLFSEFVTNTLDSDTVKVLNKKINETYNRSVIVNTSKVPVGFVHSNKLKTSDFALKPVQVDAFKFAISRNNYCLALNVGYGKTSVQISIFSYLMGTGTINKPLMIVPKPVLKNWQKELFGFWSNGNVTSFTEEQGWTRNYGILTDCGFDFYNIKNLTRSIVKKSDEIKAIKKGIILGSYEALEKMYISDKDTRLFIIERWKDLLSQKDMNLQTPRENSLKVLNLQAKLNDVDTNAEIDIMDVGFDSIYFDEAHRLKNLFDKVAADKTNRVKSGFAGSPSNRSLRAFYITQYLLKTKGRVGFLTATPFSNSPLEVYAMLVFLNYPELAKNNVNKIINFVEQFFNETLEYIVNSSSKIVSQSVMKSYKNKPILYKMLSNTFIYRQDPILAGIKRPCLVTYPNKDIKLIIKQSPLQILQRDIMVGKSVNYDEYLMNYPEIEPYLEDFKAKWSSVQSTQSKLGLGGKILAASKSSALSPFAQSPLMLDFVTVEPWRELYDFSPKIRFTIDSIKNMIDYQKAKGEKLSSYLIFVGVGVNILDTFKEALNKVCGFKSNIPIISDEDDDDGTSDKMKITYDEVEIIEGTADTNKEENRRDRVGDLFNDGKVKVIIGTDTIKEGLNLQVNCATLFILTPTWNSTDIKQIEGRIHRQGNKYGYARAITPLVTRTLDSFIYQKYEEKEGRINDLWGNNELSTTSSLDVQISPSKQKELILDDAVEIAKIRAELIELSEVNEYNKIEDEYNSLKKAITLSTQYKYFVDYFTPKLPQINEVVQKNMSAFHILLQSINKDSESYLKIRKDRIITLLEYYQELDLQVKAAIDSKQLIDLINIFKGNFKKRGYTLNIDNQYMDSFKNTCAKLNIDYVSLVADQLFESIGILTRDKNYWEKNIENIYELIEINSKCFNVEKFILNPEGLSLTSNPEELDEKVLSYAKKVDDKVISMEVNFQVNKSYKGIQLKAKPEYIEMIAAEAKIELDEENKLTRKGDQLANYFADKTNIQLDYKMSDIDPTKCNVPYSDVNVDKIISNAQIIKPEPITIIPEPTPLPTKIKSTPAPVVVTKNNGVQKLNTVGDEFFVENPDKILGEMSISDFRDMIIVKGNKNDVISYFKQLFKTEPTKVEPTKVEPTQVEPTQVEPTQVEPIKSEYTTEDIKRLIRSLQRLADMGDEDSKRLIRSLKRLV